MTILDRIVEQKKLEITQKSAEVGVAALRDQINNLPPTRQFIEPLRTAQPGIIAEIKRASPSKGVIRRNFDVAEIAMSYATHGATCLSVLTDEQFFDGHADYIQLARDAVDLPILRKDFLIDEYQIVESRALRADAILLIVSTLDLSQLSAFKQLADELTLDCVIEVHDDAELEIALQVNPALIGINNRNLKTFETDLSTTIELIDEIPNEITVVSESGIARTEHIDTLVTAGVDAFLIGEAFMRDANPGEALARLFASQLSQKTKQVE